MQMNVSVTESDESAGDDIYTLVDWIYNGTYVGTVASKPVTTVSIAQTLIDWVASWLNSYHAASAFTLIDSGAIDLHQQLIEDLIDAGSDIRSLGDAKSMIAALSIVTEPLISKNSFSDDNDLYYEHQIVRRILFYLRYKKFVR